MGLSSLLTWSRPFRISLQSVRDKNEKLLIGMQRVAVVYDCYINKSQKFSKRDKGWDWLTALFYLVGKRAVLVHGLRSLSKIMPSKQHPPPLAASYSVLSIHKQSFTTLSAASKKHVMYLCLLRVINADNVCCEFRSVGAAICLRHSSAVRRLRSCDRSKLCDAVQFSSTSGRFLFRFRFRLRLWIPSLLRQWLFVHIECIAIENCGPKLMGLTFDFYRPLQQIRYTES